MTVVKSVLTEEWLTWLSRSHKTNAAISPLIGKGTEPLRQMLHIYDLVENLSNVSGFELKLREYLYSDRVKGQATRFELDLANRLAIEGADIRFPKERGAKVSDINGIFLNQPFSLECKFLHEKEWERATGDFMMRITQSEKLQTANERGLSYKVELDPALMDLTLPPGRNSDQFRGETFNEMLFENIASGIESSLLTLFEAYGELDQITEPGLFRVSVEDAKDGKGGNSISAASASLAYTAREIIRKVILACSQLPSGSEGYVAIHSHHPVTESIVRYQLNSLKLSNPELSEYLNGILVFPQAYINHAHEPICASFRSSEVSELMKRIGF